MDCSDTTSPATRCTVEVQKTLPCGHLKTIKCYQSSQDQVCKAKCEAILDCEHPCTGNCGDCDGNRLHRGCGRVCDRPLICGHKCRERCGLPCHCREPCEARCGHNKCQVGPASGYFMFIILIFVDYSLCVPRPVFRVRSHVSDSVLTAAVS